MHRLSEPMHSPGGLEPHQLRRIATAYSELADALEVNPSAETTPNAAVAAIAFALGEGSAGGLEFLRAWNEGDFQAIREEWPEAPEAVYIGADPLYQMR
jgi:GH24 family phage-related lysozyme (muramidase)